MSDNTKPQEAGFTLVELLITISVMSILSLSVIAVLMNYFTIMTRNNHVITMTVASQNLLRATVEELRYSAGVRQTNTISDPNGPSGGWNTSNTNFVIIIAVPAVDSTNEYIINPLTGSPYINELVYFKADNELHKRTLAHPEATGNSIRTSCPAALASASCPGDINLIDHAEDMVFTLYDQDDAITNDPLLARSIKITLQLERDSFGKPLELTNSIRVTLRNTF